MEKRMFVVFVVVLELPTLNWIPRIKFFLPDTSFTRSPLSEEPSASAVVERRPR